MHHIPPIVFMVPTLAFLASMLVPRQKEKIISWLAIIISWYLPGQDSSFYIGLVPE